MNLIFLKKLVYLGVVSLLSIGLAACGNDKKQTETIDSSSKMTSTVSKESSEKSKETIYAQGFELSVLEQSTAKHGTDKKKAILSIKIQAKNKSNEERGFGSSDFYLKNGKEKITPYVDGVNFGEAIKGGKDFQGVMTFEIPRELKKVTLVYRPYDKEIATWNLTL